jgi:3-methylcrotonyl-CoA carboxylase alpha subunit
MSDSSHEIWVTVNGERFLVEVEDLDQRPVVAFVEGSRFEVDLEDNHDSGEEKKLGREGSSPHSIPGDTSCEITAPMPGDITEILVKTGQGVKAGDPLCVLDAMKMKNIIHAPSDGVITEITVDEGKSVEYGVRLFRMG